MRAILTYHSIDDSGSPISVAPDAFAAHVRWLASGRVRVVSLDALAAGSAADDGGDVVAITFDDAFANFAEHAAPRLVDHGLPATLFVVSRHVGRTNAWGGRDAPGVPTLPLLHWDALGRLAESGIALGGHTRTHPYLGALTDARMADEIEGGAMDITAYTGHRPTTFAYPYGDAPTAAARQVRQTFRAGVTTSLRPVAPSDDAALLPRLDAFYLRAPQALERWGTLRFGTYLRIRAVARLARRTLPFLAPSTPDRRRS